MGSAIVAFTLKQNGLGPTSERQSPADSIGTIGGSSGQRFSDTSPLLSELSGTEAVSRPGMAITSPGSDNGES